MSFFRDASLVRGWTDMVAFFRTPRENRLAIMLAACVPPFLIIFIFNLDVMQVSKPPPPEPIYIESWPLTRTNEEVLADMLKRQKEQEGEEAAQREAYKALGRITGMPVDQMVKDAEVKRRAEIDAGIKAAKEALGAGDKK